MFLPIVTEEDLQADVAEVRRKISQELQKNPILRDWIHKQLCPLRFNLHIGVFDLVLDVLAVLQAAQEREKKN